MKRNGFERAARGGEERLPLSRIAARRGTIPRGSKRGWKPRKQNRRPVSGEIFLLTSPFIEHFIPHYLEKQPGRLAATSQITAIQRLLHPLLPRGQIIQSGIQIVFVELPQTQHFGHPLQHEEQPKDRSQLRG